MRRFVLLAAATTLLPVTAALAGPLSHQDSLFIKKAAIGGMTEVQEGQTAVTTASAPSVKDFAQKMVAGHTANNQELASLASTKGVTVPTDLDKMHAAQADLLSKKTGADFDRAYIKAQIKDHMAMEKVMQTESESGQDPDLKAFAAKTLPVVQDHLNMLKALKTS